MSSESQNRSPSTLRRRLTVWHLGILAATLAVFAVSCYAILSRSLYRHHDEELAQQAAQLVEALAATSLTQAAIRDALLGAPISSRIVMVRDGQGELIYRDPVLESSEPNIGQQAALRHAAQVNAQSAEFFTMDLQREAQVRFICVPLLQGGAYLQIGDPLGEVRETLRNIVISCVPLFVLVLVLSSFGGAFVGTRALDPMRSVTATLEEIQARDLSRRVDVYSTDRELRALVTTLNELLDRLQRAFESLREFAGDVSHQIQTPLTVIRGALDQALRNPDRAQDAGWVRALSEEVDGIRSTVVNLRSLALADAPIEGDGPVELSEAVAEAGDIVAALGELRDVAVTSDVEPGIRVRGDATRLKQVVLNLGDNAVKYTPAGGRVAIRLGASAGMATLQVEDTGIGIPEEHLPRLFDRLFRVEAGGRSADGTGLGLAIAKRIVDVHGGTIMVQSRPGAGSVFTVTLPTAVETARGGQRV